jgi:PhnB protein
MLMGSDVPSNQPAPVAGSNFYIMLDADSAEETERVFHALSEGGKVEMPLAKTEWAEKYGMCRDKFGIAWMLNFTGDVNWEDSVK